MKTRSEKQPQKRTRAAEPASFRSSAMIAAAAVPATGLFWLIGTAVNHRVPSGIIVGVLALLISAGMLAYWWKAYRDRGLKSKPRISFREVYVLYFGMSVEVGLIVQSMLASEFGVEAFALILPPLLIGVIAAMDDTPFDRNAERAAARGRFKPRSGSSALFSDVSGAATEVCYTSSHERDSAGATVLGTRRHYAVGAGRPPRR